MNLIIKSKLQKLSYKTFKRLNKFNIYLIKNKT